MIYQNAGTKITEDFNSDYACNSEILLIGQLILMQLKMTNIQDKINKRDKK